MDELIAPVQVGLISDTHITNEKTRIPRQAIEALQGVDLILHAGDIDARTVLDELEILSPVLAAEGDDDWIEDTRVKPRQVLNIGGLRPGLIHDFGYGGETKEIVEKLFGTSLDIVVYGHTHQPRITTSDGILLIASDSCTVPCRGYHSSVGILKIQNGQSQAHIVELN